MLAWAVPAAATRAFDMLGFYLRFYVHEHDRHQHQLVWEWLLSEANKMGIRGGTAFKSMAGFGRHHVLHKGSFFELSGAQAIDVELVVTPEEANQLLQLLRQEKLRLFYARIPVHFGVINPDKQDPGGRGSVRTQLAVLTRDQH